MIYYISINEKKANNSISSLHINSSDSIHIFLSKFLINGNNLKILKYNYDYICIFGFCILIVYIICFILGFLYMKNKYYNKSYLSPIEKKIKIIDNYKNIEKDFFKILSYLFFLIVFFHQYITEYYIFGFLGYFLNLFGVFESNVFENDTTEYSIYVNEHLKKRSIEPIAIIFINLITIILLLLFFILFMIINSTKTLFINNGIPFYGNNKYLIIKLILSNFNPIYGLINSFNNNIKLKLTIILIIIFFILILIDILLCFYNFSFYPNKINYFCLLNEFFMLFTIITEIVLYITNSQINSSKFHIFKLIVELLNSLIFTAFFIYKKNINSMKIFINNLFTKTIKNFNQNDIYYYFEIYIKYSEDKRNNYKRIFRLFQNHVLLCKKKECPCNILLSKSTISNSNNFPLNKKDENQIDYGNNQLIDQKIRNSLNFLSDSNKQKIKDKNNTLSLYKGKSFDQNSKKKSVGDILMNINKEENNDLLYSEKTYDNSFKEKSKDNDNNEPINKKEIPKLKDEKFKIIGEQEIINRINYLYNCKNYSLLENYIFIHLQYLIKINNNYRLALYFVGKYSLSNINLSFLSRYYLYEIKKYICKNIFNLNDLENIKDSYIIKYKEENISMKRIKNYFIFCHMIRHLLKISCEKIIYFYKFRKGLHNYLSLQKYIKSKIYPVIKAIEEMKCSISKLKSIIHKLYKNEKKSIESVELSFLLSNFYNLIEGKLSKEFRKYFSPLLSLREFDYKNISNEFHKFLMNNPLIISLTNNDTFEINYFTNNFLDILGYNYFDLKNKDFHDKLFPGKEYLYKEHSLILKQFLFFNKNVYSKEKTFLKSKEGYLISINFICKSLPNFKENFSLIADIIFNDDISEYNKTSKIKNKEKNANVYSFFLDRNFYIFGLTKNFYLEYYLNLNFFRELKINFCRFFCVDEIKLIEQIEKEIIKILKKYKKINHKILLKEANKAYSIFANIKFENIFKLRDSNLLENYLCPTIFFYDKIDKKKLIISIPDIMNIIDENGLDNNWNIKLKYFRDKLIKKSNYNRKKDSEVNYIEHEKFDFNKEQRFSTVVFQKNNAENYNSQQYFEIIYSIKILGSFSFYIVNLYEKTKSNYDHAQVNIEFKSLTKKDTLKLINKKISKIGLKKVLRMSGKFSSPKTLETEEMSNTNSKGKLNNLFNLSESNKNIFSDKTLNDINIIYENQINEGISNKYSENSIESNLNNQNKEEFKYNDNLKNIEKKRKNILFNKEIIKNIKNENEDDEENSLLMSKDKFNVLLIKNKRINKILIIIIYSLILMTMILIIIKISFCSRGFKESNNIEKASIYLEILKIDIYIVAIYSLIYCIYEKETLIEKQEINSKVNNKLKDIMSHLKIVQNEINIILNNKYSLDIFKVVEDRFLILTLNNDWSISERKNDILNEIRSLSYILYNLSSTNETCNITMFYEYGEFKNEKKSNSNSNSIQKIFFYIISNIISNFQISFEKLSNQCVITLDNMWHKFQKILFLLLYSILIILISFIIVYIFKAYFDYLYYKLLFIYYYNIKDEYLKFKNKIYYLYKTILEFNFDNIKNFENNNDRIVVKEENKKNNKNNIKDNTTPYGNDANKVKYMKRASVSNKNIISNINNNNLIFEQNLNGSILNGSNNGSSIQFLNNSKKKLSIGSINEDNNLFSKKGNKKEVKNDFEEDSLDFLLNISYKILPNSLKISFFVVLFSVIIFMIFSLINIFGILEQHKNWENSINMLMNILERVPRLIGMVLYSCINVITNNLYSIKKSQIENNQSKYLKYFQVNSLYYSEDIINKYFNNSYFGILLKDNLRINYNLENYLLSNDNFIRTRNWEIFLNKREYFCIYAIMGEMIANPPNISFYDFLKMIEIKALNCIKDNKEINEYGAKNEINYILQEITNKYIDFITYKTSNISLEQARKNFFGSKEIKKIFNDLQYSFILHFNAISNVVILDFIDIHKNIENIQNIYNSCLLFINFSIFLLLVYTIKKGEKYKQLFFYISEIPKSNNIS